MFAAHDHAITCFRRQQLVAEPSDVPGAAIEVGYPLEPEGCRGSQGFRPRCYK